MSAGPTPVYAGTGSPLIPHVGICHATGKLMLARRSDARRVIRNMHDKGMREYRCRSCQCWHTGHLPPIVRRGRLTAAEVYG